MQQFRLFTAPSRVNCVSSAKKCSRIIHCKQLFQPKKLVANIKRFSRFAGFSCSTKLILYVYHFRMDIKIFSTVDQDRDKSCDTTRALNTGYWERDSLSTTAKATSSTVLFEIHFLPLLHITPKYPISSNFFNIFFSKPASTQDFFSNNLSVDFKRR